MTAALLFIVFSALTGLTVAHLLSIRFWRKLFFVALVLSGIFISYLLQHDFGKNILSLLSSLPTSLVARAALGTRSWVAVCELALLMTLAFLRPYGPSKESGSYTKTPVAKGDDFQFVQNIRTH